MGVRARVLRRLENHTFPLGPAEEVGCYTCVCGFLKPIGPSERETTCLLYLLLALKYIFFTDRGAAIVNTPPPPSQQLAGPSSNSYHLL